MNKWTERAEEFKAYIAETEEWIKSNWGDLPEGVRRVLIRGRNNLEEKIETYEEYAKK
ncbi:hypothetical protein [Virgibacillus litoralis]|uniref:General stress protein CsbD n=1 Tax=Virgibacillus litoralis TaxID=578221 RepID=A0ABS4HHP9_9BACI|nr:hypothetical protein [Virgibacillus litoralis]MBP1950254.1 hypothetical protein [Virgibacillus litoralis]